MKDGKIGVVGKDGKCVVAGEAPAKPLPVVEGSEPAKPKAKPALKPADDAEEEPVVIPKAKTAVKPANGILRFLS